MATQNDVFSYIQKNYRHEVTGAMTLKIEVPTDGLRSQMVYAAVTEHELQVTSPFAWQSRVSAEKVFETIDSMFGVVAINGAWALKHNVFIADIDESEIAKAFAVLAVHSDDLEKSLGLKDEF